MDSPNCQRYCGDCDQKWVELAVVRGHFVLMGIIWAQNVSGVEGWPQIRGFFNTILNGDAVGTKVSVRYREGGRSSEVVVKRGSTVSELILDNDIIDKKV